jgi:hypothetical protein
MNSEDEPFMRMLGTQAADDAAFLGWVLRRYLQAERLSDSGLAAQLGLDAGELPGLCLCLRPRQAHFVADLHAIATRYRVSASVLGTMVRHVEALEAMRGSSVASADEGLLMAARTRPAAQTSAASLSQSDPADERADTPPTREIDDATPESRPGTGKKR